MSPRPLPPIPTGIQRLLRMAAGNRDFRARLLVERDALADEAGVELTPTERLVLRAASVEQLEAMADNLPPIARRRDFIRQSAATAAALIGGPLLIESCVGTAGARPDVPPPAPTETEPPPDAGTEEQRPERNDMQGYGGMAPDEPPPPNAPQAGIQPDLPPERQR